MKNYVFHRTNSVFLGRLNFKINLKVDFNKKGDFTDLSVYLKSQVDFTSVLN